MNPPYLFTSNRLGFRTWRHDDQGALQVINSDHRVMKYFPHPLTMKETAAFTDRMQKLYTRYGHCYFAVEHLDSTELMGFIGIGVQDFEAPFTPIKDLGWRLAPRFWQQGYATEGAKRCMKFAKEKLKLKQLHAIAPEANTPSIGVMKSIGMEKMLTFDHPVLLEQPQLRSCALYRIGL